MCGRRVAVSCRKHALVPKCSCVQATAILNSLLLSVWVLQFFRNVRI
jgi:hypothetical protein